MNTFTIILIALVTLAVLALTLREVRQDGLGRRPAPRSHRSEISERTDALAR